MASYHKKVTSDTALETFGSGALLVQGHQYAKRRRGGKGLSPVEGERAAPPILLPPPTPPRLQLQCTTKSDACFKP